MSLSNFEIRSSVADLMPVSPFPGLTKMMLYSLTCLMLLVGTYLFSDSPIVFVAICIINGFVYSAAMTTTHDAIHHTLTGWRWFDEVVPRLFSYFIFWPHGIYSALHRLHHRMNGKDSRDPESATFTLATYKKSNRVGKFYIRNQLWLSLFVFGGIGLVVKHVYQAIKLRDLIPSLWRIVLIDVIGISICFAITLVLIAELGYFWPYVGYFLIMERIIGFSHHLRSFVEHHGLQVESENHLLTKLQNCRNIETNKFMSHYFNGLNFHSVHHAFPGIPFYNLPEAHSRLERMDAIDKDILIVDKSYLRTAWNLGRRPKLIG